MSKCNKCHPISTSHIQVGLWSDLKELRHHKKVGENTIELFRYRIILKNLALNQGGQYSQT